MVVRVVFWAYLVHLRCPPSEPRTVSQEAQLIPRRKRCAQCTTPWSFHVCLANPRLQVFCATPAPHRHRLCRRLMEPQDGSLECTCQPAHDTHDILGGVALSRGTTDAWPPLHAARVAR